MNRVAVVFTHEEYRQSLQHGEVQRLGEHPLLRRAVAEEADDDRVRAAEFECVGIAGGVGDGGTDNRGCAHHAALGVDEAHRPALTSRAARYLAVQFRNHGGQVAAPLAR